MIGVFDSGSGGLTVLAALRRRLPGETFLYLGDHAQAPYGGRSAQEVFDLTVENVEALFRRGCRLVILACNTAAAVALRRIQQEWLPRAYPENRVLGVLVPMVEAVTQVPFNGGHVRAVPGRRVAVFATRRTVESGAYPAEIERRAPGISVVQQACPDLVARIETAAPTEELRIMVQAYARRLCDQAGWPDAAILGCTHYPLVEDLFRDCLPPGVPIFSQPALVAEALADYLERRPRFAGTRSSGDGTRLLTTGCAAQAQGAAERFLTDRIGGALRFRQISISDQGETGGCPGYVEQRQAG